MSVVQSIITKLDRLNKPNEFDEIRKTLKNNKKLCKKEWTTLQKLVKTTSLYKILKLDLNKRETCILGNALVSVKLPHVNDVVDTIINKNDSSTPHLLIKILEKRRNISIQNIRMYLYSVIQQDIKLIHLELLHVVHTNYPEVIDSTILEYCRRNSHEICKRIVNKDSSE